MIRFRGVDSHCSLPWHESDEERVSPSSPASYGGASHQAHLAVKLRETIREQEELIDSLFATDSTSSIEDGDRVERWKGLRSGCVRTLKGDVGL